MKEYKYKNESEDYEMNYNLEKNGLKTSENNRENLKILTNLEKIISDKKTLTNSDYDKIISENIEFFEKKKIIR